MKKDIAIVILNYIQYSNVMPGIKELIKEGYQVDFYCPNSSDTGFNNLFNDVKELMIKEGYNVYSTEQNINYKVLMEPYPSGLDIKSKYKIRYKYSNISAKPNIVYKPQNYICYDAILSSGEYDYNILNVFTQPYITGNQKYIGFKKKKHKSQDKKVLLYLPTYGDESSIDIIHEKLKQLRDDYYIIAKIHHGTCFLTEEIERIEKIKNSVDEFYDLHKDLPELLARADVVLTDNSGALFEAIYTEVPVAAFSDNINKNKKEAFDTTQYELYKKGILPYTNDINQIEKILKKALSKKTVELQREWNRKNLYHPKDLLIDFVNTIKKYLNDDINERYYEMHNILKNEYYGLLESKKENERIINEQQEKNNFLENKCQSLEEKHQSLEGKCQDLEEKYRSLEEQKQSLEKECNDLKSQIQEIDAEEARLLFENKKLGEELEDYENGKLYKLATKLYKIKNGR